MQILLSCCSVQASQTMEHWQFLIQKQGDRSWHPLSSNTEILEGSYRVVARFNHANTDVEVRVTSTSTEDPSKRRVNRRSRRTNSEGLMAVIPFTYLKPGNWELQCSGDLMSDFLGKSWQYGVQLQVLSSVGDNLGQSNLPQALPVEENQEVSLLSVETAVVQESAIASVEHQQGMPENRISAREVLELGSQSSSKCPPATPLTNPIPLVKPEIITTQDSIDITSSEETVLQEASIDGEIITQQNSVIEEPKVTKEALVQGATITGETPLMYLGADEGKFPPTPLDSSVIDEPTAFVDDEIINTQSLVESETSEQLSVIDAAIDEPVTPVWVKGDSAEQILHNLIEFALPTSEPLLEDEPPIEDLVAIVTELPLLLTLNEEIYFTRWGKTISINGHVEIKEHIRIELGEISDRESLLATEVRISMRSPEESQIFSEIRQALSEKLLPFSFISSVEIPKNCSSKLILADISLYGVFDGVGEVKLLASQSFTIAADVTELLVISAAKKSFTEESNYALLAPASIPETPVSLDLELFNLVKAAKQPQALLLKASPTKSLPPRLEPRRRKKSVSSRSPQLPSFNGEQTGAITVISETIENEETTIFGSNFPYLRRLKALPDRTESVEINQLDSFDFEAIDKHPETTESDCEQQPKNTIEAHYEDVSELISEDTQHEDDSFAQLVVPRSAELMGANSPELSPLIQKWMQSQGYTLPETIDVQYQDYTYLIGNEIDIDEETTIPTVEEKTPIVSPLPPPPPPPPAKLPPRLQLPPPPPPPYIKPPSPWLAKEIVVDDPEIAIREFPVEEQPILDIPVPVPIMVQLTEPLPIPQLYVQEGELISGKSLRVRVELPAVSPQIAVKLWVQDYQTRWLLDGPHWLTDLRTKRTGVREVTTQLQIPFGCLEIRIEAIAVDMATQQESHKVTIIRSVIPDDLPTLLIDELFGM